MIVRPRPHWFRTLSVWQGSVLPIIAPQLAWTAAFAALVTITHGTIFGWKVPLSFAEFSLIGMTLAIFLAFRNNASYARWWEARTLWGAVLNETRALLRQGLTLVNEPNDASTLGTRLIAFVHALRHRLRGTDPLSDFARVLRGRPRAPRRRALRARAVSVDGR